MSKRRRRPRAPLFLPAMTVLFYLVLGGLYVALEYFGYPGFWALLLSPLGLLILFYEIRYVIERRRITRDIKTEFDERDNDGQEIYVTLDDEGYTDSGASEFSALLSSYGEEWESSQEYGSGQGGDRDGHRH